MASLADYKGGNYLRSGDHLVTVMSYEASDPQKCKTDGINFHLENDTGRGVDEMFWLTDKALPRLSSFADACGLSEEAKRAYDPMAFASHRALVNRRVWVRVVKPGKFSEVDDWWPVDAQAPAQQAAPPPPAPPSNTPPAVPEWQGPKSKYIPF